MPHYFLDSGIRNYCIYKLKDKYFYDQQRKLKF